MEWSLGITSADSFMVGIIVLWGLMVSILTYCIIHTAIKGGYYEKISALKKILGLLGFSIIVYLLLAFNFSLEISDREHSKLNKKVEPYKENPIIKELLKEAKKDNKISLAESQKILSEVDKIEDQQ